MTRGEIWDAGHYKTKQVDIIEKQPNGTSSVRFKTASAAQTPELIKILITSWHEYQRLINNRMDDDESDIWFPNEVVNANLKGDSLIKAWREHLGLTQEELAAKAGIKQPALARLEKSDANPRTATLKKLADAMRLKVGHLID